ncbi:MAG: Hpt domain-containing protein [Flavobacteriaceae bacterium]|nr:Hpt domain-containing protein [Flavobacteriaceae bacterium]
MQKLEYRYINLQKIEEDTFGDRTILKMIIELFIEGIDEFVGVLNKEMKNKNWQVLFQATHKIKPNLSMFGIKKLEPAIHQLENNFRNEQDLDNVEILVNSSISIFKQVKVELQTELKSMNDE